MFCILFCIKFTVYENLRSQFYLVIIYHTGNLIPLYYLCDAKKLWKHKRASDFEEILHLSVHQLLKTTRNKNYFYSVKLIHFNIFHSFKYKHTYWGSGVLDSFEV